MACNDHLMPDAKPWCYTTDPGRRWELCDIPMCYELETSTAPETTTAHETTTAPETSTTPETTTAPKHNEQWPFVLAIVCLIVDLESRWILRVLF